MLTETVKKFKPPTNVMKQAKKGLILREKTGRGGTQIGLVRARQLSKKTPVSYNIIKRMVSYFARHSIDKKAKNFGNDEKPSNGYIAWLLWGGDAGKNWAESIKNKNQP